MTTYRNASPVELELPTLALGGPIEPGKEFDSDEPLVGVHLDRLDGDEWVNTAAEADAQHDADAVAAAEQLDEPEKPKRATRSRKSRGGSSA